MNCGVADRPLELVCGAGRLLPRQLQRELAVSDALREALGEARGGFLAIGCHEFGKSREQAGLCEAIAVDALETRFGPGFMQIAERGALLLMVGRVAARCLDC